MKVNSFIVQLNEGLYDPGIFKAFFLAGGPGSGKSTYSKYLIDHFDITHIYPGGMLRKEVEKNSEIGKQVKAIIDRGEFVPNQIVLDLIKAQIEKSPKGYILDGWPRYMQQVEDMEKNDIGYDYAVFLDVSREEVMNRLLARGRVDDTREIINNRIDLYKRETGPVSFLYSSILLFIISFVSSARPLANNLFKTSSLLTSKNTA